MLSELNLTECVIGRLALTFTEGGELTEPSKKRPNLNKTTIIGLCTRASIDWGPSSPGA